MRYRQTGKKPKALAEMPKLQGTDTAYFEAFQILSAARSYNMAGPNPIAISEMVAYMEHLSAYEVLAHRKRFVRHIQRLDDVLMAHQADKAKAASKSRAKGAQPTKPQR